MYYRVTYRQPYDPLSVQRVAVIGYSQRDVVERLFRSKFPNAEAVRYAAHHGEVLQPEPIDTDSIRVALKDSGHVGIIHNVEPAIYVDCRDSEFVVFRRPDGLRVRKI